MAGHVGQRQQRQNLTWEDWAGAPQRAAVTEAGRPVLAWAVDTLRDLFGNAWLQANATTSGHVPLMSPERWPLANPRAAARLLEIAARAAVVRRHSNAA